MKEIISSIIKQHIGCITLNRPEHMNTFNSRTASEFYNALMEFDSNPEVFVILITILRTLFITT